MRTFETEKHNIPEGATHYANETDTDCFIWYREDTKEVMVDGYIVSEWEGAGKDENLADIKPIPQTKEVEWLGVGCTVRTNSYGDGEVIAEAFVSGFSKWLVQFKDTYRVFDEKDLSKPETEAERVERERLDAAYDLYCHWCFAMKYPKFSFDQFNGSERDKAGMLAIVEKTNYRKEE
jgi:hypothetical protein